MDDLKERRIGLTEHLANERTLLAYVRTSIALTGFGLTLNRFAVVLSQLPSASLTRPMPQFERLGAAMVLLGLGLLVWSAINFHRVRRATDRQDYHPSQRLVWVLAALLIVLCLASVSLLSF